MQPGDPRTSSPLLMRGGWVPGQVEEGAQREQELRGRCEREEERRRPRCWEGQPSFVAFTEEGYDRRLGSVLFCLSVVISMVLAIDFGTGLGGGQRGNHTEPGGQWAGPEKP